MQVIASSHTIRHVFARGFQSTIRHAGILIAACLVLAAPTAVAARAITIVATNYTGAAASSLNLAFSASTTETNTLFVAYGGTDKAEDINAWDHVDPLGVVPPETNAWTYTLPRYWGDKNLHARFFFAQGVVLPYDYRVEYLEGNGNQLIRPPAHVCDTIEYGFMQTKRTRREFIIGIDSYVWYDITSSGGFTGGGTCELNTFYAFVTTNGPVWINGVRRGDMTESSTPKAALFDGRYGCGFGGNKYGYEGNILSGRSYYARKLKDGYPVFDAVPCVTNGVACFYDTISRTFFYNAYTGSYTPGPKVGFTRDQTARIPVSSSATFTSDLSLLIVSDMEAPYGMVPAPGFYSFPSATNCTAPVSCETNNARYTCLGYTLETFQDGTWQMNGTNSMATTYAYPDDGVMRRLTWLWTLSHFKVERAAVSPEYGSIAADPAPADCYYPVGSTVTFTATPATGHPFAGWSVGWSKFVFPASSTWIEDCYSDGSRTLTTTVDKYKVVTAYFSGNWVYVSGSKLLTNGVWKLSVKTETVNGVAGLTITGNNGGHGRLDLATCFADTGYRVVKVGSAIFKGNTKILSFIAPDVTYLDGSVFHTAPNIEEAILSENLTTLAGNFNFYCSYAMTNFYPQVAPKLTTISGERQFIDNTKLKGDFKFPVLTKLSCSQAFENCKSITSIEMPACTNISAVSAFKSCSGLTNVVLSTDLGYLAASTFYGCTKLKTFQPTYASKFKYIGDSVFQSCGELHVDFDFPNYTGAITLNAAKSCGITSLSIPKASSIGNTAFDSCKSLTNLVIGCTTYGGGAFQNCTVLTNVVITAETAPSLGGTEYSKIARGARIWYRCPFAPSVIGASAFATSDANKPHVRIYVRRGNDMAAWRATCTRLREPSAGQTALTAVDLARADFPGRRTIGLIASNSNYAWVIDWPDRFGTQIMLR